VQPPGRFGAMHIRDDRVVDFVEKPDGDGGSINGGFFVLEPSVIELIDDDAMPWEGAPMQRLVRAGQLGVYRHFGFWQPMDTLRDKHQLEQLWHDGRAPWRRW
jgi:glucose-1-phosphate cytidylyltransferase